MTVSTAFYAKGAEILCHPWNCVVTSALQAYRHCLRNEGSAGLIMLQDAPMVN